MRRLPRAPARSKLSLAKETIRMLDARELSTVQAAMCPTTMSTTHTQRDETNGGD
jgi:hypothetical protein